MSTKDQRADIELIRVPSGYMTPDERWLIERAPGWHNKWSVTDTTGGYVWTTAQYIGQRYATMTQTLDAAKAFIANSTVRVDTISRPLRFL